MKAALKGIRIIDLSRVLAGPYCTMILGDLGAEVIKIEHTTVGDETREWGPPFVGGESAYYICANRNKKGMTLNLKSEKGKEILKKLVADADVVIQNFKPGTLERMGIGYDTLKEWKNDIIFASISGFGKGSAYENLPGYDYIIQAMSGMMSITGEQTGEPLKVGVAIVDVLTGLYTCIGILAALQHRNTSGEGQEIDISLFDCGLASLVNVASNYLLSGNVPKRLGNQHPNIVPYQVFETNDGELVVAVGNDEQFTNFVGILGMKALSTDERFSTNKNRLVNKEILIPILQEKIRQRSKKDLQIILNDYGIPNGPILNIKEALSLNQTASREMVVSLEHPTISDLKVVGSPLKLSKTPVLMNAAPPLHGEHTEEILINLGYTKDEIALFYEKNTI